MTVNKIAKWSVFIALTLAATLYLLLLAGVWVMQDHLMFGRRTQEIVETPDARTMSFEEVLLAVEEEQTYGWWLPTPDAKGTVLFSHGSGRNISGYLDDVALFHEAGLSVMLYDYGGYGRSAGNPSEARCYADARAMWDYLVNTRNIPSDEIILAGSSMGSGVTCELAIHVSPAAVLLESAFTSVPDTLWGTYPFFPANWICRIQFRNIDKVNRFQCPVLIIHSKDDTVVPFAHGQQLYQRVASQKKFVEIRGAHYGGKFKSRDIYLRELQAFLDNCLTLPDNDDDT